MVKIIAKATAFWDGVIKEAGEEIEILDEIWNDETKRPLWATLKDDVSKLGEKVEQAVAPVNGVPVPLDWQNMAAGERKLLAKLILGQPVKTIEEADKAIADLFEKNKAELFADAPAPQVIGQTVGEAMQTLTGKQPDWLAPPTTPKADI